MDELDKFYVPVLMVVYADTEHEAIHVVENAIDVSDLINEDGVFSIEVVEDEIVLQRD